jgi:pyroglutamyl-peptidase
MPQPLVLVTGFGPYEEISDNPSRDVARGLEREPPRGVRVAAAELPVSFANAPRELARWIGSLPEPPTALLGLGMQRKPWFRLERRARGRYDTERLDNEGLTPSREPLELGPALETVLDLEPLAAALRAAGAQDVRISEDAGGYVCDRVFRELLTAGERLGVPAAFLHVPPAHVCSVRTQVTFVRELASALALTRLPAGAAAVRRVRSAPLPPSS